MVNVPSDPVGGAHVEEGGELSPRPVLEVKCRGGALSACPRGAEIVITVAGTGVRGVVSAYAEPIGREGERVFYLSTEDGSVKMATDTPGAGVGRAERAVRIPDTQRAGRYRVHAYFGQRALEREEMRGAPGGEVVLRTTQVFFQSPDDFDFMRDRGLVTEAQALVLPGSGVDLKRFQPRRIVAPSGTGPVFVFAGRMLREKGLSEMAEAMRRVQKTVPAATCRVYGFLEPGNPRFVTREETDRWTAEGVLDYRGPVEDVREAYAEADCVVLPTYYREGVPKSLLEAAAMGLPLIATSLTGCRAAVQDGVNGFLCEPRDVGSLTDALLRMIAAGPEGRARMGRRGRERVEAAFSEERVTGAYLNAAKALLT
jgi:glycosyltransferase involved in cell wall biosynthesis